MVFNGGRDHMITGLHQAENCQVVRLGAAAGKYDLRRTASQEQRHGFTGSLYRSPRFLSMMVNRRCVAECVPGVGTHGLKNLGQNGRRSVVIQIYALHDLGLNSKPWILSILEGTRPEDFNLKALVRSPQS